MVLCQHSWTLSLSWVCICWGRETKALAINMKACSWNHTLSCSSIHDNPWLQREKQCSGKKYETCLVSMPGINLSLSSAFKGINITDKSQDFSWIKLVSGKVQIKYIFMYYKSEVLFPPKDMGLRFPLLREY